MVLNDGILSDSRLAQAASGHHREPSLTPTFATRPFSRGLAADAQAPRRRLVAGALPEEVGRPRPEVSSYMVKIASRSSTITFQPKKWEGVHSCAGPSF